MGQSFLGKFESPDIDKKRLRIEIIIRLQAEAEEEKIG